MDMIGRIRRLHSRKNKSEREISRMTGLSRNTVSKWLHGEVDGPPKYRRGEQPNKLTVFHEALKQALNGVANALLLQVVLSWPPAKAWLRGSEEDVSAPLRTQIFQSLGICLWR